MIQAVFTIGIVLTVIAVVLAFILTRTPKQGYGLYVPYLVLFIVGLLFLLFATILEKTIIMGAGLGGWGLACVFSAAIGFIIAAILDAYSQEA